MVVTRRMAKQRAIQLNRQSCLHKFKIRECFVRLQKLPKPNSAQGNIVQSNCVSKPSTSEQAENQTENQIENQTENQTETISKNETRGNISKKKFKYTPSMWEKEKKKRHEIPGINAVVLAKMKGFSPWPSKLVSLTKTKASVYFFGTNNHGEVSIEDILLFRNSAVIIKSLLGMNLKHYRKAVREAEICQGVPLEYSLLN